MISEEKITQITASVLQLPKKRVLLDDKVFYKDIMMSSLVATELFSAIEEKYKTQILFNHRFLELTTLRELMEHINRDK